MDISTTINEVGQWFCKYNFAMLVQSSVLIAVLLVLDLIIKKRVRAVVRYCIWMLVLVKLVLPTSLCMPTGLGYWAGDPIAEMESREMLRGGSEESIDSGRSAEDVLRDGNGELTAADGDIAAASRAESGLINADGSLRIKTDANGGATEGLRTAADSGEFASGGAINGMPQAGNDVIKNSELKIKKEENRREGIGEASLDSRKYEQVNSREDNVRKGIGNRELAIEKVSPTAETDLIAGDGAKDINQISWQGWVFMGWVVGVLILVSVLVQRYWFVRSLIEQSEVISAGRLKDTLEECREKVGLGRKVELRLTRNMMSPAACGLIKPVVLLPEEVLEKLNDDKLRAVLLHELAHIKRGDLWVNLAQTLLQIVYFFSPLLWVANAIIRGVREKAVDEMVVAKLEGDAAGYSTILLDIAEIALSRPHFSLRLVGVVESKKALTDRIKHILSRTFPGTAKVGIAGMVSVLILAAVLLPMASGKSEKNSEFRIVSSEEDKLAVSSEQSAEESEELRDPPVAEGGLTNNKGADPFNLKGDYKISGNIFTEDSEQFWEDYFALIDAAKDKKELNSIGMNSSRPEKIPASNAVVKLTGFVDRNRKRIEKVTQTDNNGNYSFNELPGGQYWLSCKHEVIYRRTGTARTMRGEYWLGKKIDLGGYNKNVNADIRLDSRYVSISGRVVDQDGKPIANALVIGASGPLEKGGVGETSEETRFLRGQNIFAKTDADGYYQLEGFKAAHYVNVFRSLINTNKDVHGPYKFFAYITVQADGYNPATGSVVRVPLVGEEQLYRARRLLKAYEKLGTNPKVKENPNPVWPLAECKGSLIVGVDIKIKSEELSKDGMKKGSGFRGQAEESEELITKSEELRDPLTAEAGLTKDKGSGPFNLPLPDMAGKLVFYGKYKHISRRREVDTPSTLYISREKDGSVQALAYVPWMGSYDLAAGNANGKLQSFKTWREESDGKAGDSIKLDIHDGKVTLDRSGVREDKDNVELNVPTGAVFNPNARPDSYCADNIFLRGLDIAVGTSKEFIAYDWDTSGEAMASYTFEIANAGKENVTVPAGTFEANHYVLKQTSTGKTWFKKRAGHVTDYWVMDDGIIVRVLRHREPYEIQLLKYEVIKNSELEIKKEEDQGYGTGDQVEESEELRTKSEEYTKEAVGSGQLEVGNDTASPKVIDNATTKGTMPQAASEEVRVKSEEYIKEAVVSRQQAEGNDTAAPKVIDNATTKGTKDTKEKNSYGSGSILFANGVMAKVVGIGNTEGNKERWWSAKGNIYSKPPFDTQSYSKSNIAIWFDGLSNNDMAKIEIAGKISAGRPYMQYLSINGETKYTLRGFGANIDSNKDKQDIRIGIAKDSWETIAECGPECGENGFTRKAAAENGRIPVMHRSPAGGHSDEYRLAVVDAKGVTYDAAGRKYSNGMMTGEFDIAEDDIAGFKLQKRKYTWETVKDVAMVPDESLAKVDYVQPKERVVRGDFAATRQDGLEVELMGVTNNGEENIWWQADGSELKYVAWDRDTYRLDRKGKKFVFRVGGGNNKPQLIGVQYKPHGIKIDTAKPHWNSVSFVSRNNQTREDMAAYATSKLEGAEIADLEVKVECGEWQEVVKEKCRDNIDLGIIHTKDGRIQWHEPFEKDGKTYISATLEYHLENWQIVVIDKDGKTHIAEKGFNTSDAYSGFIVIKSSTDVPLADIDYFCLQKRDRETFVFRNVSLVPGKKTEVRLAIGNSESAIGEASLDSRKYEQVNSREELRGSITAEAGLNATTEGTEDTKKRIADFELLVVDEIKLFTGLNLSKYAENLRCHIINKNDTAMVGFDIDLGKYAELQNYNKQKLPELKNIDWEAFKNRLNRYKGVLPNTGWFWQILGYKDACYMGEEIGKGLINAFAASLGDNKLRVVLVCERGEKVNLADKVKLYTGLELPQEADMVLFEVLQMDKLHGWNRYPYLRFELDSELPNPFSRFEVNRLFPLKRITGQIRPNPFNPKWWNVEDKDIINAKFDQDSLKGHMYKLPEGRAYSFPVSEKQNRFYYNTVCYSPQKRIVREKAETLIGVCFYGKIWNIETDVFSSGTGDSIYKVRFDIDKDNLITTLNNYSEYPIKYSDLKVDNDTLKKAVGAGYADEKLKVKFWQEQLKLTNAICAEKIVNEKRKLYYLCVSELANNSVRVYAYVSTSDIFYLIKEKAVTKDEGNSTTEKTEGTEGGIKNSELKINEEENANTAIGNDELKVKDVEMGTDPFNSLDIKQEWKTIAESYKVNSNIPVQVASVATDYGQVVFGNAYSKDDGAWISTTDDIDRNIFEVRIVAIDIDGNILLQNGGGSGTVNKTNTLQCRFDTELSKVSLFEIQIRNNVEKGTDPIISTFKTVVLKNSIQAINLSNNQKTYDFYVLDMASGKVKEYENVKGFNHLTNILNIAGKGDIAFVFHKDIGLPEINWVRNARPVEKADERQIHYCYSAKWYPDDNIITNEGKRYYVYFKDCDENGCEIYYSEIMPGEPLPKNIEREYVNENNEVVSIEMELFSLNGAEYGIDTETIIKNGGELDETQISFLRKISESGKVNFWEKLPKIKAFKTEKVDMSSLGVILPADKFQIDKLTVIPNDINGGSLCLDIDLAGSFHAVDYTGDNKTDAIMSSFTRKVTNIMPENKAALLELCGVNGIHYFMLVKMQNAGSDLNDENEEENANEAVGNDELKVKDVEMGTDPINSSAINLPTEKNKYKEVYLKSSGDNRRDLFRSDKVQDLHVFDFESGKTTVLKNIVDQEHFKETLEACKEGDIFYHYDWSPTIEMLQGAHMVQGRYNPKFVMNMLPLQGMVSVAIVTKDKKIYDLNFVSKEEDGCKIRYREILPGETVPETQLLRQIATTIRIIEDNEDIRSELGEADNSIINVKEYDKLIGMTKKSSKSRLITLPNITLFEGEEWDTSKYLADYNLQLKVRPAIDDDGNVVMSIELKHKIGSGRQGSLDHLMKLKNGEVGVLPLRKYTTKPGYMLIDCEIIEVADDGNSNYGSLEYEEKSESDPLLVREYLGKWEMVEAKGVNPDMFDKMIAVIRDENMMDITCIDRDGNKVFMAANYIVRDGMVIAKNDDKEYAKCYFNGDNFMVELIEFSMIGVMKKIKESEEARNGLQR